MADEESRLAAMTAATNSRREWSHGMGEGQGQSARRGAVVSTVVLAALMVLILAGCNRPAPVVVTSVHVVETNASLLLDRTLSDAAKAQRLYDVVQAQPKFPP